MLARARKLLKWAPLQAKQNGKDNESLILKFIYRVLDDILLWKKSWVSICYILLLNMVFVICSRKNMQFFELIFCVGAFAISLDALENWLKQKHRTGFLQKIAGTEESKVYHTIISLQMFIGQKCNDFLSLRQNNSTKSFLVMNIILGLTILLGKSCSGFLLIYLLFMSTSVMYLIIPYVSKAVDKINQYADSEGEIDHLIPEVSEQEMKNLTFEIEPPDEKQVQDFLKIDDLAEGDASDSSDSLDSNITNITNDKIMRLTDNEIEISSDSTDDEYIPTVQPELTQTTLEIIRPSETWGNSAWNIVSNVTASISNMIYSSQSVKHQQRVSSADSSEGFEIIDKDDLNS